MAATKVTMKDVADRLGVSINAVSIVLNNKRGVSEEMRIKILRAADEMGYIGKKAKFMRTFSRANLCVMMQQMYAGDMSFYSKVLYSVVEVAKSNGFDTLMSFFDDGGMAVPNAVAEHRIGGIIVIGKISDKNIETLQSYGLPLVLVDHASLLKTVDSILTDNKLGGFTVTKYLLDKGFQRIGYFGDLDYSLSIQERFFGFQSALRACGPAPLPFQKIDDYVRRYSLTDHVEAAVRANDSRSIAGRLKAMPAMPQAFVCSNDYAAISLLAALQSLGRRVPEDVSLVGFDNIDICERVTPKLTTVNVNKETMGKRAVQRIQHLIAHRNSKPENTVMSVELIERDSVRLPPAAVPV